MIDADDTGLWRLPPIGYKKRQRVIWIRYEVRSRAVNYGEVFLILTGYPAMTASQMRIAETIDAFYGDAGTKDGVSRSYKQAVEDLDAETIKALDGPYRYHHDPNIKVPNPNIANPHCFLPEQLS